MHVDKILMSSIAEGTDILSTILYKIMQAWNKNSCTSMSRDNEHCSAFMTVASISENTILLSQFLMPVNA